MDWIKFGWGADFSPDFSKDENMYLDMSKLTTNTKPLLEVSTRVIQTIASTYPGPYQLMATGGIDSQAMIWCWHHSGIPFTITTFRYIGAETYAQYLNQHDTVQLEQFCDKLNIKIQYLDFNVIDFIENHMTKYASEYHCTSPQICSHMKMCEILNDNGTVLLSGNFNVDFVYNYTILGLKRYTDKTKKPIIPFFFLHDPELAGITTPKRLTHNNAYEKKIQFYRELGIPIIPQPNKQSGFEIIKDYYDSRTDLKISFKEKLRYSNKPSKRKFDIMFRYRYHDLIPYRDQLVVVNLNNNKY
jgi:hypothetical protein